MTHTLVLFIQTIIVNSAVSSLVSVSSQTVQDTIVSQLDGVYDVKTFTNH